MIRAPVALAAALLLASACSEPSQAVDAGRPYVVPEDTGSADTGAALDDVAQDLTDTIAQDPDAGTADVPDVPTCPPAGGACTQAVWSPDAGACVLQPANEGQACSEATCVVGAGKCKAGDCVVGPAPCQGVDPEGCWTERCDDATVTCLRDEAVDGTPCAGVRWCLDGACGFVPKCTTAGDATTRQYDADCAGNTGCTDRCDLGVCGCWQCDGPFCVAAGCDQSTQNPTGPAQAKASLGGLPAEPAGGVVLDPQPIVTAAASIAVAEGGALALQLVFAYPGLPETASWGAGQSQPIPSGKVLATRLLVLRATTLWAPCATAPETTLDGPAEALKPTLGDGSTVEFDAIASMHGVTHLAAVRVIEDSGGARYLQWVRLGGLDVTADALPGEPVTLTTEVLGAIPTTAVQPLSGLWAGVDWAQLVLDTL